MKERYITIPISPGELIDRITILEIKQKAITDETKLKNVNYELSTLLQVDLRGGNKADELKKLHTKLREVNQNIWDSENDVREFWNDDAKFAAAARNSHFYNDERAKLKREINELLGSKIIEEKSHPKYEHKK